MADLISWAGTSGGLLALLLMGAILQVFRLYCMDKASPFSLTELSTVKIGASDVQANYTRGYTWSANQFGHISLGLLAALLFTWIGETACLSVFDRANDGKGLCNGPPKPVTAAADGADLHATIFWTHVLLCVLAGLIWGLAVQRNHRLWPQRWKKSGEENMAMKFVRSGARSRRGWWLFGIASLAFFVIFLRLEDLLPLSTHQAAAAVRVAFPCLVIAGVVLFLCAPLQNSQLAILAAAWAGLVLAVVLAWEPLDHKMALPLIASIAGVGMWYVKEWGNDIPKVHLEIETAEEERRCALHHAANCTFPKNQQHHDIQASYLADARWDTFTDAIFYTVGGFLGFAILYEGALSDPDANWTTGTELTAYFTMLIVFVLVASNALRDSAALDRTGTPYSSRLAVFGGAACLPDPGADDQKRERPLDWMKRFAKYGFKDPDKGTKEVDLIVIGPDESGRTPLAIALTCEAALAHPRSSEADGKPERRKARFISLHSLLRDKRHLNSTEELHVPPKEACFIAIDDVPSHSPDSLIERALRKMGPLGGQRRVVWVLDYDPTPGHPDEGGPPPDLTKLKNEAIKFRQALHKVYAHLDAAENTGGLGSRGKLCQRSCEICILGELPEPEPV